MSLDFNDAQPQQDRELIPNGTIVPVVMTLRPGRVSRPDKEALDGGWLTASRNSDVLYLSAEFTVTDGPHARRKFWQNFTVEGGAVNEKGESKAWNITKSTLRAILNSARNIKPDDESPKAMEGRRIGTWGDLDGLTFVCKVRVQPAKDGYQPSNSIGTVIEPGHRDYAVPEGGAPVARAAAPAAAPTPAWGAKAPAPGPAAAASNLPAWAR